ncbi:MAG TPA: Asd/ArgC dimerization domain-containing protein [Terriglobia bacterium]|nr:Asd/ArgC dimerization domain-containing protein [Terriglobia bacterium]
MKLSTPGYRVAVSGASSLLGKELLTVLEERKFPVSQLITPGADVTSEEDLDLPILDLAGEHHEESEEAAHHAAAWGESEADIVFHAGRGVRSAVLPEAPGGGPVVIDLNGELTSAAAQGPVRAPDEVLSIPFLDRELAPEHRVRATRHYVSAHPAAIVIGSVLLRLASRFPLRAATAQVFGPASEIGPKGIEELQKQTLNLLSFQKIPHAVFGAQLAFNLLPRLSRSRRGGPAVYRDDLTDLDSRARNHLRTYLAGRAPMPALRVVQAPVFYSMTVSLYVETEQAVDLPSVTQAVNGGRLQVVRFSDQAPSQVDVAGTENIVVDALTADADHPSGIWLWATADNLRLAAINAVEIAESLSEQGLRPSH